MLIDFETIQKREQELKVQQLLLEAHASRLAGAKDYSQKEAMEVIDRLFEKN